MVNQNLNNTDGLLKDSYAAKKTVTPQTGFQKLTPFHKRLKGINFSKFSGGVPKVGRYNGR